MCLLCANTKKNIPVLRFSTNTELGTECTPYSSLQSEMGIYRDNLSAIVIGGNFLSIIVIAKNSLDLSITVIAFVIYFVIADKLSR